jgi:acetoin utilization deacetylase AcuC-like enzyme
MATGFFWDERCFWHSGGNYAFMAPVGGLVQPTTGAGLPENPETKRRLKNLLDVTGLARELACRHRAAGDRGRPHARPPDVLSREPSATSAEAGGGELGLGRPFGPDGYDIACLSAGLAKAAFFATLRGEVENAYALSRPPGHHCLPDFPNGFCLLNNIAIAVEAAMAEGLSQRIAVIDWDVHHGNGTEAIFYDRDDVLTISIHQERNYPQDSGDFEDRGSDRGRGLQPQHPAAARRGARHLSRGDGAARPADAAAFQPDAIVVACGFDASGTDPLSRMMAGSDTFQALTEMTMQAAGDLCDGRLTLVHEGGYSEVHVPFCGHATIAALARSSIMPRTRCNPGSRGSNRASGSSATAPS